MRAHVSRQDHAYQALAEHGLLLVSQITHEVIFFALQETHSCRRMPVLLDGLLMIADGPFRYAIVMENVREAIVFDIVTGGSDDHRRHLKVREVVIFTHLAIVNLTVGHLGYVCRVQIIVILHLCVIPALDGSTKANQFLFI